MANGLAEPAGDRQLTVHWPGPRRSRVTLADAQSTRRTPDSTPTRCRLLRSRTCLAARRLAGSSTCRSGSARLTPPPRPAAGRRSVAIHGYGRTVGQVRLNHTVRVIPDGYPIRALLENRWTYRKPVRTSPKRGVVRLALLIRHCPHVRFLLHFSTHITGIIGIGAGVWHCLPPPGIYPVIRPIYAVGGCPAMGSPRPRTSRS